LMSIHALVVTSGPRFGDAEAAAVAAVAGPQFAVVSGGVLCLAGILVVMRAFPQLVGYEQRHDELPATSASASPSGGAAG
jgi:hypothetical protein